MLENPAINKSCRTPKIGKGDIRCAGQTNRGCQSRLGDKRALNAAIDLPWPGSFRVKFGSGLSLRSLISPFSFAGVPMDRADRRASEALRCATETTVRSNISPDRRHAGTTDILSYISSMFERITTNIRVDVTTRP